MYKVLTHSCFAIVLLILPHLETFTLQIVTSADRVTLSSRLGNPPRRVTPCHLSCKRDQGKIRDYMDVPKVPHLNVNRP